MATDNLPIEKIVQLICAKIQEVQGIYLFGSSITKFATAESDIDLAFLAKQKIDVALTWQTAQEIASMLKKDVDLIDLRQASTVMRWQVINNGKRIFVEDNRLIDEFENIVLSTYIRFNDERREILEEIQRRGSVL